MLSGQLCPGGILAVGGLLAAIGSGAGTGRNGAVCPGGRPPNARSAPDAPRRRLGGGATRSTFVRTVRRSGRTRKSVPGAAVRHSRPHQLGGVSADGRTIVYRLLRSVRWSDEPAGDVGRRSSFTLRASSRSAQSRCALHEGYDLIDRANAPDARTVVFHLRQARGRTAVTTPISRPDRRSAVSSCRRTCCR